MLPSLLPRSIEMRVSGGNFQQRYVGDPDWLTMFPLDDLTGPEGPAVEMRQFEGQLQYRAKGRPGPWVDLLPLAEITPPKPLFYGGMTETIDPGEDAAVTLEENEDGSYTFSFEIPEGRQGEPGPPGTGDMTASAYDPFEIHADAFDASNQYGTPTTTFATVAALFADTSLGYTAFRKADQVSSGDIIQAGGFRYAVAPSDATAHHVTTAGGLKLYVMLTVENEIHVDAWGAVGDGTATVDSGTDNAAVLQKICDYVTDYPPLGRDGKPPVVRFGAGKVYAYSVSPNWSTRNWVRLRGSNTTLRNLGTGDATIFDSGASVTTRFNLEATGFLVEGKANSGHGVFIRSVHHSLIDIEVRGCGSNKAGFQINFAVCTEFRLTASVNRGPWYDGARPQRGVIVDRRNTNEGTTACYFPNPIIEGVAAQGIFGVDMDQCLWVGGTSEANAGTNVELSADCSHNIFDAIDLEVSGSGNSFIDRGRWNEWRNIYADQLCTFTSTSRGCVLSGMANSVTDAGTANRLENLRYNLNAGTFVATGNAVGTQHRANIYNVTAGTFPPDVIPNLTLGAATGGSVNNMVAAVISTTAWAAPTTVPGISKKDGISLPGAQPGDVVTVNGLSTPEAFTLTGLITAADTLSLRAIQHYGTAVSPFPSGVNVRVIALRVAP